MRTASSWPLLLFAAAATLCLVQAAASGSCKFQALFNFGDSNSDTGGFWAAFPAQPPPFGVTYFRRPTGRASDGRLVIDFLAQAMGLPFLSPYLQSIGSDYGHGANFATLAATAFMPNTSVYVSGISPFYLGMQLQQMKDFRDRVLRSTNGTNTGQPLPPPDVFGKSIYTIDIGQNDFTSDLASSGLEIVKRRLPSVISIIIGKIQELYGIGGRTFMVFNMAPIGCYPAFLVELPHSSTDLDEYGCMKSYNDAVTYYNDLLNSSLAEYRSNLPGTNIVYVDKHSIMLELFRHPGAHGLKYGTKACCGYGGGAYNFHRDVYCGNRNMVNGQIVSATACADPQNYVSWDGIHATEAANRIITSAIIGGGYMYPPFDLAKLCQLQPI